MDGAKVKAAKLRGMRPMPDGSWVQVELSGPGSLEASKDCYKVARMAATMLGILTPAKCEKYLECIEEMHRQYGA